MIVPFVPVSQRQTRLMVPTWGFPNTVQAVAVMTGGMKNGRAISTSSVRRPGVSVRATIQANSTASATAIAVLTNAMPSVSTRMRKFSAEKTAL